MQKEGFDCNETYAPVIDFATARATLTIAAIRGMEMHQLDAKTAFLNGELKEEARMKQPKGLKEDIARKLLKSLYGLKQAPRAWLKALEKDLKKLGFKGIEGVERLFAHSKGSILLYALAHVDDALIISSDAGMINWIKEKIDESLQNDRSR